MPSTWAQCQGHGAQKHAARTNNIGRYGVRMNERGSSEFVFVVVPQFARVTLATDI